MMTDPDHPTDDDHDHPTDEYDRGPDHAGRDRVPSRQALLSKRHRDRWAAGTNPVQLETGEVIPQSHLEALRRFKRDQHILLLASDDLPAEVKDVIEQAERFIESRLRELEIDVEPHRVTSETDNQTKFL